MILFTEADLAQAQAELDGALLDIERQTRKVVSVKPNGAPACPAVSGLRQLHLCAFILEVHRDVIRDRLFASRSMASQFSIRQ